MSRTSCSERHRSLLRGRGVPAATCKRIGLVPDRARAIRTSTSSGCRTSASRASTSCSNACADVLCERAFLPDDVDTRGARARGQPARAASSRARDLRDFDVLAFSVSFENDYLHVLQMLRAGRHPAARAGPRPERSARRPGRRGDVPEPGAPGALRRPHRGGRGRGARAADDGRARSAPPTPRQGLESLQREGRLLRPVALRGALPRRTAPSPPTTGRARSCASAAGRARWRCRSRSILTPHTEMSMKFMVEISRGCPCMCRFCWAGLQLPAGARLLARRDRGPRARGARSHEQDRPRLHRGLRPSGDRRHRGRPGRAGLRGLGRLAAPRRPHARVRLQAGGHRACRA